MVDGRIVAVVFLILLLLVGCNLSPNLLTSSSVRVETIEPINHTPSSTPWLERNTTGKGNILTGSLG
ncbi:TPA: hypothetical protein HA242_06040 [Candidatus Woesearchaeota archaeon]|nr:hypothetical protein [Candidatus Woesearchaeota archaeon]HIG92774.1 hypothetical protein [Candidatus Woesearchaeota archaeon]HIH13256.1 hypothetical protein [Candidatus Woesearchaeota archaeon]